MSLISLSEHFLWWKMVIHPRQASTLASNQLGLVKSLLTDAAKIKVRHINLFITIKNSIKSVLGKGSRTKRPKEKKTRIMILKIFNHTRLLQKYFSCTQYKLKQQQSNCATCQLLSTKLHTCIKCVMCIPPCSQQCAICKSVSRYGTHSKHTKLEK